MLLPCLDKTLDLTRPNVMGILNVTPDSFSDGGRFFDRSAAVDHATTMVEHGADIIDVGGESTRPQAKRISTQEELDRVIPVIESLSGVKAVVSVDTSNPHVMEAAVSAGAGFINDVRALSRDGAVPAAAACRVPVCLMHMQGTPQTMQSDPKYDNVVSEVSRYLAERKSACIAGGIAEKNIVLDPGFGFGKTLAHNLSLLRNLEKLKSLNTPLLVGLSRKSMLQQITGRSAQDRVSGSLALALLAVAGGANIVRVHDVAETVDVMRVFSAVNHDATLKGTM